MSETLGQMIVHQSCGLHEGVTYRAADKGKSAFFHIFRHCIRQRSCGRHIGHRCALVLQGFTIDKIPQISVQSQAKLAHLEIGARIFDEAIYLEAIAHNTGILQQGCDLRVLVTRYLVGIEVIKNLAVVFAFAQNGYPAQTRLGAFETKEFEQFAIVVNRRAPFVIVIVLVEFIVAAPPAAVEFRLSHVIVP